MIKVQVSTTQVESKMAHLFFLTQWLECRYAVFSTIVTVVVGSYIATVFMYIDECFCKISVQPSVAAPSDYCRATLQVVSEEEVMRHLGFPLVVFAFMEITRTRLGKLCV